MPGWRSKTAAAASTPVADALLSEKETERVKRLNDRLETLADLFPDVQFAVFREMLLTFDEESQLHVISEMLLRHRDRYVRGRLRVEDPSVVPDGPSRSRTKNKSRRRGSRRGSAIDRAPPAIDPDETIRTERYKAAAYQTLKLEFPTLASSTVRAVMAENNSSYTKSRKTLSGIYTKSWRLTIRDLFVRRPKGAPRGDSTTSTSSTTAAAAAAAAAVAGDALNPITHPLLRFMPGPLPAQGGTPPPPIPTMQFTPSSDLNQELLDTILSPLLSRTLHTQLSTDALLAQSLNEHEASTASALLDCQCCFSACTFETLLACDSGAHLLCRDCVRATLKEALFGQGWARGVQGGRGSLRCFASVGVGEGDGCDGVLPRELVRLGLGAVEEPNVDVDGFGSGERDEDADTEGAVLWRAFGDRLARDALRQSGLPLASCPFCAYAEEDSLWTPGDRKAWTFRWNSSTLSFVDVEILLLTLLVHSLLLLLHHPASLPQLLTPHLWQASLARLQRRHRTSLFTCRAPLCRRTSCLSCGRARTQNEAHSCTSPAEATAEADLLLRRRAFVTNALSERIKRVCPACGTGFVKDSGCNRMVCVCGYRMCYLCREGIGVEEGYAHFCGHFRVLGRGPCAECRRCELYGVEDEEGVMREEGGRAEGEWERRVDGQDERDGEGLGQSSRRRRMRDQRTGFEREVDVLLGMSVRIED